MKYTNNAIYTVIRAAVLDAFPSAKVTQTYSPTPTHFPTAFIRKIGRFTPQETATMSNSQEIYETTWEVQVYSNLQGNSKEEAYDIMRVIKRAFKGMYFLETFETPQDTAKNEYYTLIARFRRIIGDGEEMPN